MTRHTLRAALALPLLLATLLFTASGCEKEPINSDVEGFWRLESFTTRADGRTTRPERLFVSIQLWVVRLGNLPAATTPGGSTGHTSGDPSGAGTYTGRYAYSEEEGTVRMWDFSTTSEPGVPNYGHAAPHALLTGPRVPHPSRRSRTATPRQRLFQGRDVQVYGKFVRKQQPQNL